MKFEKHPAVYIMASRYRGTIYTGVTSDLGTRVQQHRDGSFGGFLAKHKTHTLVWYEHHDDMPSAILRETRIKAWRRQRKIDLIETINRDWLDLSDYIIHRPYNHTPSFQTPASAGDLEPRSPPARSGVPDVARLRDSGMTGIGVALSEGITLYPGRFDTGVQLGLLTLLRAAVTDAPLFTPVMPRTGKAFSVRMTNLGSLGWVSDAERGYRYQPTHPLTGNPWPPIPDMLLALWCEVADYPHPPEACLVNFYTADAKMGLHQDRDEKDFAAPVVSVSLGDSALFRWGGTTRGGKTQSVKLQSGDVLVMGGAARLCFHGIDRIYPGTSTLLKDGGRINLTLRRVTA